MEHISESPITSMEELSKTPLWEAYLARNTYEKRERFFSSSFQDFQSAMKASGEHLRKTGDQVALGMYDGELAELAIPATLILHHGSYIDYLHPITNSRAATTLISNSSLEFAPYLPEILNALVPFIKTHTPRLSQ